MLLKFAQVQLRWITRRDDVVRFHKQGGRKIERTLHRGPLRSLAILYERNSMAYNVQVYNYCTCIHHPVGNLLRYRIPDGIQRLTCRYQLKRNKLAPIQTCRIAAIEKCVHVLRSVCSASGLAIAPKRLWWLSKETFIERLPKI